MWIDATGVCAVLGVSMPVAYKVIRNIKAIQDEQGYCTNPRAKVPIKLFCECYGLEEDEVREIIKKSTVVTV